MANFIPYTVKTTVTFGGRSVSQAGFGNAVFVAHHNLFASAQKLYSSVTEMLEDGWADGAPAIQFANGVFNGKQSPDFISIAKATPLAYQVQVNTEAVEDDVLSINMKLLGVAKSFAYTVLDTDITSQLLGDGLAALIAADAGITSATSDANGLIVIVPVSLTDPISFGAALNTTIATTTSDVPADIMASVFAEYSDFSTVSAETHISSDVDLYATYAESNDILYVYSTSDVDVYDPLVLDDVFSVLKGKQYQYTMGMFNENADIEYPEGAILGSFLTQSPSYNFTMSLQDLAGITPSKLTVGQKAVIVDKNGNYYELEYDVGAFKEGFTSNGDFIDRSRFGLWVKLRSQESMFATMKSFADRSSALAYSDAGIQIAKLNLYTDVINVAIANGSVLTGYSTDSAGKTIDYNPIVTTSTRASQTNAAIGQRLWEGFELELIYTGSIHHISSKGYVINNRVAS